jgi:phospholysine phosphohistidine inorganic pyrophosphate phosphatase
MSAILFDLDGVLYEDDNVIEGAAETIKWFSDNAIPHLFLTNTTSKSRTELVNKLAGFNIESAPEEFLTPPVAACQWLSKHNINNIALFVPETTKSEFSAFTQADDDGNSVEAVIVGDLGDQWTFKTMNDIFQLLMDNPEVALIALGMTRYWRSANGLQLDVGPMIKAFEYATGIEAVVTGKPAINFYRAAINLLSDNADADESDIIMIGDDIRGDIEASQHAGLKAILVRTGKFLNSDLDSGIQPEAILDSIAELPGWWRSNM